MFKLHNLSYQLSPIAIKLRKFLLFGCLLVLLFGASIFFSIKVNPINQLNDVNFEEVLFKKNQRFFNSSYPSHSSHGKSPSSHGKSLSQYGKSLSSHVKSPSKYSPDVEYRKRNDPKEDDIHSEYYGVMILSPRIDEEDYNNNNYPVQQNNGITKEEEEQEQENEERNITPVEFQMNVTFVTPHFSPVQKCNATVHIQNNSFTLTPDSQGRVQLQGQVPAPVKDEKLKAKITISSGIPPNQIVNSYTEEFIHSSSDPKLYVLQKQFIIKPNNPLPTHVLGRVVNEAGVPIPGAELTVIYDYPIFQDQILVKTKDDGTFDAEADLEQFIPIFGNIIIDTGNFSKFDLRKDTEYTDGFYLMNHLTFKFDNDFILPWSKLTIDIPGIVVDQNGDPVPGVKVTIHCQSGSKPSIEQSFVADPTDKEGKFHLQKQSIFESEEEIVCEIIDPIDSSDPSNPKKKIVLKKKNDFKVPPVKIGIVLDQVFGHISGKVISELTGFPIQDPVTVSFKDTGKYQIFIKQVNANSDGQFNMTVNALKGEKYQGELLVSSEQYQNKTILIDLNPQNKYTLNEGTIRLDIIHKVIDVLVDAEFAEKFNDTSEHLTNFPVTLILTEKGDELMKKELKTNSSGKIEQPIKVNNTENYIVQLISHGNEDFEDINIKKDIGVNSTFNGNFNVVEVHRKKLRGQVGGIIMNEDNTPVSNSIVTIHSNPRLPGKDEVECKTDEKGKFLCEFDVESGREYDITIDVSNQNEESGTAKGGKLNKKNNYKLYDEDIRVKMKGVRQTGKISGKVKQQDDAQNNSDCTYEVTSITPSEPYGNLNKKINCDKEGQFEIDFELNRGKKYQIEVDFQCPPLENGKEKKVFELNLSNNYTLNNQIVQIHHNDNLENDFGIFSGRVFNIHNDPINNALVQLSIHGNNHETHSNMNGAFSMSILNELKPEQNNKDISAQLNVTCHKYHPFLSKLTFHADKNFTISNYEIIMKALPGSEHQGKQLVNSSISGQLIDEKSRPVIFGALSLVVRDSFRDPTQLFPIEGVSDLQGRFYIPIQVWNDDDYVGILKITSPNFYDRIELFEFNKQNDYAAINKTIRLERQNMTAVYSGIVLDSLKQLSNCTSVSLTFDDESKDRGATDLKQYIHSNFHFQQILLKGYQYKAQAKFQSKEQDYLIQDVVFSNDNNYQITNKEVILPHKLVQVTILGVIKDKSTQKGLANAQAMLHFEQNEFKKYNTFTFSDNQGKFEISQEVEEGFEYSVSIIASYPHYKQDITNNQVLSKINNYILEDLALFPVKATEDDSISGSINGHTLEQDGRPIPHSLVHCYCEDQPHQYYNATSNERGEYNITNINFVQGNTYACIVSFNSNDKDLIPKKRKIYLSQNDSYTYTDLQLTASRDKKEYLISGRVVTNNDNTPLQQVLVSCSFFNQLDGANSFTTTDKNGYFELQGRSSKGVSLQGNIILSHSGYKTISESITLPENGQLLNQQLALDNHLSVEPYPFDINNPVKFKASVFEITKCSLFPHKFLSFTKVSLFFEDEFSDGNDTFMAYTFSNKKGQFTIKSPRPFFSDVHAYLLLEKQGFDSVKVYHKIEPSVTLVNKGGLPVSRQSGVIDCSRKERKIQDKFNRNSGSE